MKDTCINTVSVPKTTVFPPDYPLSNHGPMVRVFRNRPGGVELQIRSEGSTTVGNRGTMRRAYSHISLNENEVSELITALYEGLQEIADLSEFEESA